MSLLSSSGPVVILLCAGVTAWGQLDDLEVTLTPAAQEYCHVLRLPEALTIPSSVQAPGLKLRFGSNLGEYEFRIEGPQGTRFLMGGFTDFYGPRSYTTNRFRVDLADPAALIGAATQAEWDAATIVPFARGSKLLPATPAGRTDPLEFNGFQFEKSGEIFDLEFSRLSPDQAWLVLQSEAIDNQFGTRRVFFDVFRADTGKKIVTIKGAFSSHLGDKPVSLLARTGWVAGRYFIVPLGKQIQQCLVCEFTADRTSTAR